MSQHRYSSDMPRSAPVELGNLSQPEGAVPTQSSHQPEHESAVPAAAASASASTTEVQHTAQLARSRSPASSLPPLAMPPPALTRQETEAIGPSTDLPTPMLPTSASANTAGPVIIINLLLTSTGTRHPYKIDEKYLSKRGVAADGEGGTFDPFVISVYTLKELIWRDWREEWEPKPSSPSAIRLIHFGRLLEDKAQLKDCRFNATTPNVVHMSVKPAEIIEEEEATKGAGKSSMSRENRDEGEGSRTEETTSDARFGPSHQCSAPNQVQMHSIGKIVISQHRETPEAWTIVDFQNGLKKHGLSVYYKNSDEYRRGLCRKLRQYDLRKSASTQNYEAMTLTEIKRLCSERNISQSSRKSWEELRDELVEEDRRILAHLMAKTLPLPAAMALKGIPGLAPLSGCIHPWSGCIRPQRYYAVPTLNPIFDSSNNNNNNRKKRQYQEPRPATNLIH
ncbi:hypothetical protein H2203_006164 [Taxawa tesnikishii (nom. ined.)]|nr:hypothetical protein H2203_006164 [Dothideales sp. JES 119]